MRNWNSVYVRLLLGPAGHRSSVHTSVAGEGLVVNVQEPPDHEHFVVIRVNSPGEGDSWIIDSLAVEVT